MVFIKIKLPTFIVHIFKEYTFLAPAGHHIPIYITQPKVTIKNGLDLTLGKNPVRFQLNSTNSILNII